MGFGLLFVGFMMMLDQSWALSVSPAVGVDIFPDVIGYILMVASMKHLRKSSKDLNIFAYIASAMVIFSGAWAILQLSAVVMRFAGLGGLAFVSLAEDIYFALKYPVMIAAILFLSSGLREVALSVGLDKLSRKTAIFTVVSALGYIGTSVQSLLPTGEIWAYFAALIISLLFFVQYFMMLALIFSYYREIGFEGEDDLPEKEPLMIRLLQKAAKAKKKYEDD